MQKRMQKDGFVASRPNADNVKLNFKTPHRRRNNPSSSGRKHRFDDATFMYAAVPTDLERFASQYKTVNCCHKWS